MAIALEPVLPRGLHSVADRHVRRGPTVGEPVRSSRLVRWATVGAIGYVIAIPALDIWYHVLELLWLSGGVMLSVNQVIGVAIILGYLPLRIHQVWYALRGRRPPAAGWTLGAIVIGSVAAAALLAPRLLGSIAVGLAMSVLIVVRPPWSFVIFGGILVGLPVVVLWQGGDQTGALFATTTWTLKALPVYLLVVLVGAVRQLDTTRDTLVQLAIARERLQVDGRLQDVVGTALAEIASGGDRAGLAAVRDPRLADGEVRVLVGRSRRALARARRMIRGLHDASLDNEVDTAAALLSAAGIRTSVTNPAAGLGTALDSSLRSTLRDNVARLLHDDSVRSCVIAVTRSADGPTCLEFHTQPRPDLVSGEPAR